MTVFRHTPVWSCRSLWHRSNRQMSDRCLRDPEDENTFIYTRSFAILCFKWEIRKMIMSSTLEKIKGLYRKEKKTWRQDLNHQPSTWEARAAPVSPARPGAPSPGEAQNWFMLFLVLDSFKSHYHESWGRPAASPRPHVRHVPADRNTNTSDSSRRLSASKQTGY